MILEYISTLKSNQGFWAIGDAVVDTAIGRFPETLSISYEPELKTAV